MIDLTIWELHTGDSPLVATAIHDGHAVRPEVAALLALPEPERLREEDPFTRRWTSVADTRLIGLRSRFEIDLNRPRDKAIYLEPKDAWGLHVWREKPPEAIIARSLQQYDAFYDTAKQLFTALEQKFGRFVVFDLHSYNHRREGPAGPLANPQENPEVNIGTGSLNRDQWGHIVDRFMADLRDFNYLGRHLDVRENVKFQGGNFSRWAHANFPQSACVLAIEFKKFFMDEWTGEPFPTHLEAIQQALASTVPGVLKALQLSK
ncbi:MAG: N-formylglutamate amidohydrolase [Anaerolineae bacterium]|nr:N-formylglutamate amidohydrolase [Anaerolineae bacterium]